MSFLTISKENIFFRTLGTSLGAIVATKKALAVFKYDEVSNTVYEYNIIKETALVYQSIPSAKENILFSFRLQIFCNLPEKFLQQIDELDFVCEEREKKCLIWKSNNITLCDLLILVIKVETSQKWKLSSQIVSANSGTAN